MGVLILTPLALTLFDTRINFRQAAELGALLASVAVTWLLMFHASGTEQSGTVLRPPTPFVLWEPSAIATRQYEVRDPEGPLFVLSFTFSSHRRH